MSSKQEIQQVSNRIERQKNKLAGAKRRDDQPMIEQFEKEIVKLDKKLARLKHHQAKEVNTKGKDIQSLSFNRPLTKKEQADMGQLKKSVRGLVVVHPMTAQGRQMGITVVTGFAPKEF
ncbi:YibL family ribosome-associated protein [Vibrio sp. SS-MA-C1-2]|uniref:YibL family ribosome-associated protein n=1 Tax=Vibrio sp. SS-MA-C1-2 TaxID=2908646 RepID=UPI001F3AA37E|nr:YibL family ribosome-associated protein [Vibrio sp. SS-MA-C1-2]UJF16878.1 YibL family ribosome-associated protein [Vibrio sp. SS-MA-C1-2]